MRLSHRQAQLLLGAVTVGLTTLTPAEPATALTAPTSISVHFSESTATIEWNAIPGSRGYEVTIRPIGVVGPYAKEQVLANTYTVAFTDFPDGGRYAGGYSYDVCSVAINGRRACTLAGDSFYVQSAGHGVSTSWLHGAVNKISSCLGSGEEAGLVAAAGAGVVAAVASWLPGVNVVTAANVAAVSAGRGAEKFATCLTGW